MAKRAYKKSVEQFQKFVDLLGDSDEIAIETFNPDVYWKMIVQGWDNGDGTRGYGIGVYKDINGDLANDPLFYLSGRLVGGRITELEICSYESSLLGLFVDGDGIASMWGSREKDPVGLTRRFASFMDNMSGGPYLDNPKSVVRYPKE